MKDMNTFLSYLFVAALLALITLPSFVGFARDRVIDRQLRRAAQRRTQRRVSAQDPAPASRLMVGIRPKPCSSNAGGAGAGV